MRASVLPAYAASAAAVAFALLGFAGMWPAVAPGVTLCALALLPGLAVLAPCIAACGSQRRACPLGGPGIAAAALAVSVLAMVPGVGVLVLARAPLEAARWTLSLVCLVAGVWGAWAAVGAGRAPRASVCSWREKTARACPPIAERFPEEEAAPRARGEWLAALVAIAALLPAVLAYAGGTVDDWWDLAFVRAYAERPAVSLDEPVLGTGRVHPRFGWNGWLVLQSVVLASSGADPAQLQGGSLAALVCIATISAGSLLARTLFGAARAATVAAVVFVVPWLWGTEAIPYFTRLHQDKFVVAFVLVPVMLAAAVELLERGGRRFGVLAVAASLAAASVHGLVFAVGALGVLVCCTCAIATRAPAPHTEMRRRVGVLLAALAAGAAHPLWQAWRTHEWFAAEGISLAATDNPVIRAHLGLERLIAPHSAAYVVHPGAVFGLVALAAAPAIVLAWRRSRHGDRAAAYVLALTVVPCVLLFVPFIARIAGDVFVPWMLYRVGWLVPVTLLGGIVVEAFVSRTRPRRTRAACAALLGVAVAAAAMTGADRLARDMLEHPSARERAPRGSERAVYRFVHAWPERGAVVAPSGFASLVGALAARPTVATSERGTLVFSGDEIDAYRRLRDRAAFFASSTVPAQRDAIARAYGVRLAVFRKRLVVEGADRAWLWRSGADGFLLEHERAGTAHWTRARIDAALPAGWSVVYEDRDFAVARSPHGDVGETAGAQRDRAGFSLRTAYAVTTGTSAFDVVGSAPRTAQARWADIFEPHVSDTAPASDVLASLVGWPGARVRYDPVPLGLGIGERPVWLAGALAWDDGPEEVTVTLELPSACDVDAVEVVPFLRTGRREVFEIEALGTVRRLRGADGAPLRVRAGPLRMRSVAVRVRSMVGETFALWDVRVLGDRGSCDGAWLPLGAPQLAGADVTSADLLRLWARYPNDARAAVGLARRLAASDRAQDARAVLRTALGRDPGATPAWLELGLLLDAAGRFDEALAAYRKGLATDSRSAWARGCVAWAELRRRNPVRSLYHAWRASRFDPRYADAFTIMAGAFRQLGARSRARALLERAISLDPQRSWAYLELAQLHVDGGKSDTAVEVLERLLEIAPHDEQAQSMIAHLTRSTEPRTPPT